MISSEGPYVCDIFAPDRQHSFESGCCEGIAVRIYGSSDNFCVFGVYRDPDLSDKIFDSLLTVMSKLQSFNRKATFFLFVGDENAHGASTMTFHGSAAREIASSSGCEQMVTDHTHIDGGILHLVLTDVPDLAEVRIDRY